MDHPSNRPEYVELHCHTNFSFRDGASHPHELVKRAKALGMGALAVTDHDGLYGAVRFWKACQAEGMKSIFGVELTLKDLPESASLPHSSAHITLLAEDMTGYASLCRLISQAQLRGAKEAPVCTLDDLAQQRAGLICLSGCRQGLVARHLVAGDERQALRAASKLRDIFEPEHLYVELQRHFLWDDQRIGDGLVRIAQRLGLSLVATNNVHYATPDGHRLHDVLTCIRHHVTLEESEPVRKPNSEFYLKSTRQMAALFDDLPEAIRNTVEVAERCQVDLAGIAAGRLPNFPLPASKTPIQYLTQLCQEALPLRYPATPLRVREQLAHELGVIERANLAGYFLVVWDIVRFAREQGILAQGRGSAAGSLVAYLLGITRVDPIQHKLLFERFLSDDVRTTPDIDIDFAHDRRDEVIEYVYQTYGADHTAMVANVVTYQTRSALRDIGKALGLPLVLLNQLSKRLGTEPLDQVIRSLQQTNGNSPLYEQLLDLCRKIQDFPRHLSIHVGGMLVTGPPLTDIVPVERATKVGRVVSQWNKDDVEDLGLIKMDLLALRTLSLIQEALDLIRARHGQTLCLDQIPLDDPSVYAMLQQGDTIGAFQVESRAQMQTLPRMRPERFEDIVVEVAIIRPGPVQGDMVHPYFRRRQGVEPITYLHPRLEPVLADTLGQILFQEQVIQTAMVVAGFRPGEADALRRAMSRHRSLAEMNALRDRFIAGAQAQEVDQVKAEEIFEKLMGFASYGFCKSHAAAFARTAYETCYLKAHYAPEFYCALLNAQPMGFYQPNVIVGDARRHGVRVLRVDVNHSRGRCILEGNAIRLGFGYVQGFGEQAIASIEHAQQSGPFTSLEAFCQRTRLPRRLVENLILVGAMDNWRIPRRTLLWQLGTLDYEENHLYWSMPVEDVEFPEFTALEEMLLDYEILGLSPDGQIMAHFRDELSQRGILSSAELAHTRTGQRVTVAGLRVTAQRPPTAKGFCFVTLEDEEGLINVIIRPALYEETKAVWHYAPLIVVSGTVQYSQGVTNVLAENAWTIAHPFKGISMR